MPKSRVRRELSIEQQGLVEEHLMFAKGVACPWLLRTQPNGQDEILSHAHLGLVEAARDFDPGRGVLFKTYASHRIQGAIRDGLRHQDKLPRGRRKRLKAIKKILALTEKKVSVAELASKLGWEEEKVRQALADVTNPCLVSLEELLEQREEIPFLAIPRSGEEEIDLSRRVELIQIALEGLSEKERLAILLFYWKEWRMWQIGERLGVTESRVYQIRTRALLRLRDQLKALG